MKAWESILHMTDGEKLNYRKFSNTRYFKLTASPTKHKILPEITIDGFGYNGKIPGPLLVVEEGQFIMIEVENLLDEPTALHVHGLTKPNRQDGIPDIEPTPKIEPGQSLTYTFNAWQAGTFFYHAADPVHTNQGLLGGVVVLPKYPVQIPSRDFVMILQQWEIKQPEMGKIHEGTYKAEKFDVQPNFFTINGKAFPHTTPIYTSLNEKLRIRFINKSNAAHTMHVHGHDFQLVEFDGFSRNEYLDTLNVPSGQRLSIEFWANNPGIWPINGTKTLHQTNNGVTPGGMTTRLIYQR